MRRIKGGTRPTARIAPIHALFAAAMLGLLVMPLALAGAKPTTTASGSSLRKQVKSLKKRVAALETRTTNAPSPSNTVSSLPPNGPAGGALIGSYPNPRLAAGSVSSDEILGSSVRSEDVQDHSLFGFDLVEGTIGPPELANQSVGAGKLKGTYERVSAGVTAPAGTFVDAFSTCNQGDRVLGGGYAFQNNGDFAVKSSTPNVSAGGFDNPNQWAVTAASANVNNTLFAWAVCISA